MYCWFWACLCRFFYPALSIKLTFNTKGSNSIVIGENIHFGDELDNDFVDVYGYVDSRDPHQQSRVASNVRHHLLKSVVVDQILYLRSRLEVELDASCICKWQQNKRECQIGQRICQTQ